jgi:hypothetical protein
MSRTRPAAISMVLVAVALPLAACGGSDENNFKEDYNAAVKPLTELNEGVTGSLGDASGKSNDAIAKEFDNLASKTQQTRENLADLDPPEDAKEELDRLLSALQAGTDDLKAVAEAAKSGDPAAASAAAQDLVKTGTQIQKAETDLQQAVDG